MPFALDESLHWTDHFVKYGFAVLRNQVPREFCETALEKLRDHVDGPGKNLPFDQWTTKNIKNRTTENPHDPVLDKVYDLPNIRRIITTMFGTDQIGEPDSWDGKPDYRIFINPFNPDEQPKKLWGGHIDFGGNLIPLFGCAFILQVCLRDTEPLGGNITHVPGSHKLVQAQAVKSPLAQYPYDFENFPFTEPYEFVARAGDVFLMHHLSFHSGNPCVGPTRQPRLALHLQVTRTTFLTKADPNDATNSPWVKSFTLNGFVEDPNDQKRYEDFGTSKRAMWGIWASDDGQTRYKVYTWIDGCLWCKSKRGDAGEVLCSDRPYFDGKTLKLDETIDVGSPSSGGTLTQTRCKTTLEIDPANADRMLAKIQPEGAAAQVLSLRCTERFTGRRMDESGPRG